MESVHSDGDYEKFTYTIRVNGKSIASNEFNPQPEPYTNINVSNFFKKLFEFLHKLYNLGVHK